MAYRYEQIPGTKNPDLVIDGFESGIAASPYEGIANIQNLNITYYPKVAYVNYKRQAGTATSMTRPVSSTQSPSGLIYFSDSNNNVFKQSAVNSSTFTAIGSNPGTGAGGILWWNNYLLCFRTNQFIDICGDGSGDAGITSSNWNTGAVSTGVWPIGIGGGGTITLTAGITAGDTSAVLSSYTDTQNQTWSGGSAKWNGPTGTYLATLGGVSGQYVYANLTQGSTAITWTPAATNDAAASMAIYPLQNGNLNGFHPTLVSRNDGNAYFGHQNYVGYIGVLPGFTSTFSKSNFKSFQYVGTALPLPTFEQVQWMEELVGNLQIGGYYNMYPWDRVSPGWQNPVPVQEGIYKFVNILNKLYIFAGNKGNIYVSNGYSVSYFAKMPDYIAGVQDPVWAFGGIMVKRQKLWFQATAYNTSGTPVFTGTFSLVVSPGLLNEQESSLCVENVNSSAVGSTTDYHGLLIDNSLGQAGLNPPGYSTNYDSYYSAWCTLSGGNYTGTIDYNDTTLYQNHEPFIETDLIPVGTNTIPKTFSQAEFKLDRPLANGDEIKLYGRSSLTNSYTLLATITATSDSSTQVLSAVATPFPIQNMQWFQGKITFKCASSGSSRIPLRELRLR